MSFLEIIQLVGYSFGSALHLWMAWLLVSRRAESNRIERVLLVLAFCVGLWHAGNLLVILAALLGLPAAKWDTIVRGIETVSIIAVTLCYSLLLHAHLHLWANAKGRPLTTSERARVFLSYVPIIFLAFAVPALWHHDGGSMLEKLTRVNVFGGEWDFVVAFALWAGYVLALVGATDLLIARLTTEPGERSFMLTLALSFFSIAALLLAVHGFEAGSGTPLGDYLQTLANLGSLLPTALLARHIYRHRYLELVIRNSLVVAVFAAVVLIAYLYGIRAFGEWLTRRYGFRPGVIESLLILFLALLAAPLRGWLEHRFSRLFDRETRLYRDVLTKIEMLTRSAQRYAQLPDLLGFVAERTEQAFGLHRVRFVVSNIEKDATSGADDTPQFSAASATQDMQQAGWEEKLLCELEKASFIESTEILDCDGWRLAFALRRESEVLGAMLVDAPRERLSGEARQGLTVIAGQVALAIAECRLVEENLRLERRVAHGERLATLGQMAATVAHEIKNPLSAIKSIAQVMREDDALAGEYSRDLDLIVGETNRLSRSVTQLLTWSRHTPNATDAPAHASDVVRGVVHLSHHDATRRGVAIESDCAAQVELDGREAAALRDALANLVVNALQATPTGGVISITTAIAGGTLVVRVADGGAGVPTYLRERIWEPFFTTKQRGTGLGLAIVRKRLEEVGGTAQLSASDAARGACFELHLPLNHSRAGVANLTA